MTEKHDAINPPPSLEIDLNLLVVFDVVMAELNVTRAAEKLSTTQPAVSKALNRLRRAFKDDLFIKVSSGVKPTPKAIAIWTPIRNGLADIRQVTQPSVFEPATSSMTFTIALNDYMASLFAIPLIQRLSQAAPNINLRFIPSTNIDAPALLEQSEIDLAMGALSASKPRLQLQTLFTDRYVCGMRKGHPLAKRKLTLDRFVRADHLLITLTGEPTGFVDLILREQGLQRRIVLTVNQFALAPAVLADSNLIAAINYRSVQHSPYVKSLHLTELPLAHDPIHVHMMWHDRKQRDAAHSWLRSLIAEICSHL
ncbi:MAG: LysR family transcriptional regulator [Cyanobacteria bacterium CRU_2_1]|nr:LysR family transcriptional regulator [Leptolyngbyaceae cyanobacterium SU_3_3]NJO44048.1 LysR family transcriptional regulator [Cyanobacteria bacterium RU_5_0]NJR63553.1 LysR family transcriptional regulator [Cyanobacteria bacterium CRU_2_1]